MTDINSRNHFYLGREHDLAAGETSDKPLLYKSKDLTTHAVCVGMTGSGKTGLCVSLLEEAALDGIPAIIIDPKGDLGNLLLGFEDLKPEDFRPWIDESVAERKGHTPDEFAEKTAELWRSGLGSWDQGPDRIKQLNDAVERVIYTPGASHGIPLTVLKSFDAPPKELREDRDAFRQRISSAVSGLLALLGIDADPVQSREHIFLSNVFKTEWESNKDLSIAQMIAKIQAPPFEKVGVMELETFYPKRERTKLAMDLNNLLASPSFEGWMHGQPLNIAKLMYNDEGKPRQAIISIAHLDDAERMFFVTILLNEMLAWMRTQPGTGSLRAILYMDEVFGYFPPTANPPSKEPMLTLLKQARAFGLGCVLATQNPVDLDYKGLSNAGTWFLGRLQTERDKMRVMEGLEGASAQAGSSFDKQAMERTLAGVGSRVFLMNNVHEDQPAVFHTRWAMSYLAGPLAKQQIKALMDPVRDQFPLPEQDEPKQPEENKPEKKEEELKEEVTEETKKEETASAGLTKLKSSYETKVKKQAERVNKSRDYFHEQLWQTPIQVMMLGVRGVALLMAMITGGATKRKSSSVGSAFEKTFAEFGQAWRAHGKWKGQRDELRDLIKEAKSEIGDEAKKLPMDGAMKGTMIWFMLAFYAIAIVLILVVVGWFFDKIAAMIGLTPTAIDAGAPTE